MSNYVGAWISILCAICLNLVQQHRNKIGCRNERGNLLATVPIPRERKWRLALYMAAIFVILIFVTLANVSAYTHQQNAVYALLLVVLFLLILLLLWIWRAFAPAHLYENGILDRFGYTAWNQLSGVAQGTNQFRIRLREHDFSKSTRLRKVVVIFYAENQKQRVKDILEERVTDLKD